jgi:hypothetical protein
VRALLACVGVRFASFGNYRIVLKCIRLPLLVPPFSFNVIAFSRTCPPTYPVYMKYKVLIDWYKSVRTHHTHTLTHHHTSSISNAYHTHTLDNNALFSWSNTHCDATVSCVVAFSTILLFLCDTSYLFLFIYYFSNSLSLFLAMVIIYSDARYDYLSLSE